MKEAGEYRRHLHIIGSVRTEVDGIRQHSQLVQREQQDIRSGPRWETDLRGRSLGYI